MTTADLTNLTPRQRSVVELRMAGLSVDEVAARLKIKRTCVAVVAFQAKKRIETGFVPHHGRAVPGSKTCYRGHPRSNSKRCPTCQAEQKAAAKREKLTQAARKANERLAAHGRCQHPMRRGPCGLLLPCADHPVFLEATMAPPKDAGNARG
jgi:hypothetical protein